MSNTKSVTVPAAHNFFHVPFCKLHLSPKNVRKVTPNKKALAKLAANILLKGVRQNLIVEASSEGDGHFDVLAGGRRWRAIESLVKAGSLEPDYPVPCGLQADGDVAAEASLSENHFQEPMHPADEYEAYAAMVDQGMDEQAIAQHYGCDVKHIRLRMKLSQVHPTILKAFRRGELDEQDVMAFTLAETKKAQLAVFKELGNGHHCSPHAIKRAITKDGERSDSALARFVGVKAYQKAGGHRYTDLFEGIDYLSDRELLVDLANQKLDGVASGLRDKEGWSNIEASVHVNHDRHRFHRIQPEPVGVPEELLAEQQRLEAELQALDDNFDGEWSDEDYEASESKEARLDEIATQVDAYRQYSDDEKARSVCFVHIGHDGKPVIERGYLSPQAAGKSEKQKRQAAGDTSASLSRSLLDDLGTHRQQIAKAKLAGDPKLAMDVLLYTLGKQILFLGYAPLPIDASFSCVGPDLSNDVDHAETPAGQALLAARDGLSTGWLLIDDEAESFAALRALPAKAKQALFAYCMAASFKCGAKRDEGISEAVLGGLSPDFAAHWRPNAENYFSRVQRDLLLQHGAQCFGDQWAVEHAKAKKKDLVAMLDHFFSNPVDADASKAVKAIHKDWLPEAFGV